MKVYRRFAAARLNSAWLTLSSKDEPSAVRAVLRACGARPCCAKFGVGGSMPTQDGFLSTGLGSLWNFLPVCGELLNLAENTSATQSCESFTYR